MNIEESIKLINESGGIGPITLPGLREAMRQLATRLDEDLVRATLRKGAAELQKSIKDKTEVGESINPPS